MALLLNKTELEKDYLLANISRQLSIVGRKEALSGKAKFGIFGDGKEVAQLILAKFFETGDFRSGYYRDQTFMLASGMFGIEEFFAQLYGNTDLHDNPGNGGRLMNNHFATRSINQEGNWVNLMEQKNSSADISPTAGQMPRLVGLALASKLYRNNKELNTYKEFSIDGNEIALGTIGDASTSEGHFFEALNAAGVMQIPMVTVVWDDGYGISVPKKYQTTKQNISELLKGFAKDSTINEGFYIYTIKGWNYKELFEGFDEGIAKCRKEHVPVIFHITEMTQPLGHSTSGSHERYKAKERLEWETEFDPIKKMREFLVDNNVFRSEELDSIELESIDIVKKAQQKAWEKYQKPIKIQKDGLLSMLDKQKTCMCAHKEIDKVKLHSNNLRKNQSPIRKDIYSTARKILRHICSDCPNRSNLQEAIGKWLTENNEISRELYNSKLYSGSENSVLNIKPTEIKYADNAEQVAGREILRDNFDYIFAKNPLVVAFGEDVGKLGGVNQTYEGLQAKYGENRIFDTGIREATIVGQAIGLALRGLRPIAEIQYFDYLLYALQTLSDDLATLHYRTKGGQKAPVIISTRGHRLEGIWHSGSPLSMVINSIRGIYVCVPRNMTQAAGFYNSFINSDDPAIIIEPLNGYRLKESKPENIGEFTIPVGVPEIITEGTDITIVTYGACVRIAEQAVEQLKEFDINCELIDVRTLIPFDITGMIKKSIQKTNKVLFFDEDVPGGATAYMMQKVLEEQEAFDWLDCKPETLTAKEHRPAYSTDGDYFSNPNPEDVFEKIYNIMHKFDPRKFPRFLSNV